MCGRYLWAAVVAAAVAGGAVADGTVDENVPLAAESLRDSAIEVYYAPSGRPGQALAVSVLAEMARKMDPHDAGAAWLLATLYEQQGRGVQVDRTRHGQLAAGAWEVYRAAYPQDYVAALRHTAARLSACRTAEERVELLKGVVDDETSPATVRAEAAVYLADVYRGQARPEQAKQALLKGIRLDGHHPVALSSWMATQKQIRAADRIDVWLRILGGSPFSIETASQIGTTLDAHGLHAEAATFLSHAWDLVELWNSRKRYAALGADYANALLSGGQAADAVAVLEKLVQELPEEAGVHLLLIEAYRAVGRTRDASEQTGRLHTLLGQMVRGQAPPDVYAKVAWHYAMTGGTGPLARSYARRAVEGDRSNPTSKAILAAMEVYSKDPKAAEMSVGLLQDLAAEDVFAATVLAEYYAARKGPASAQRTIAQGLARQRRGPLARRLMSLARKAKMTPAPAEGAGVMKALVSEFDQRVLAYARHPEKFLSVKLSPVDAKVTVGQEMRIRATLTNRSDIALPMGQWGATGPLQVRAPAIGLAADCRLPVRRRFGTGQLVPAIWPCGRWLAAGKSISTTVRVDVGPLRHVLLEHPFENVEVVVSGRALPLLATETSMLPALKIEPVTFLRVGLLGGFDRSDPAAWRSQMDAVLKKLKSEAETAPAQVRVLTARKIGATLTAAMNEDKLVPEQLRKRSLADRAMPVAAILLSGDLPGVRAEAAAALAPVAQDPRIAKMLSAHVGDSDEVVRLRLAETLCGADPAAASLFAKDASPLVRMMARAASVGATTRPAGDKKPLGP